MPLQVMMLLVSSGQTWTKVSISLPVIQISFPGLLRNVMRIGDDQSLRKKFIMFILLLSVMFYKNVSLKKKSLIKCRLIFW